MVHQKVQGLSGRPLALVFITRLVGQAVKTPASHAGNGGSIPPRVTTLTLRRKQKIVGVDDAEGPPVPIPNTEVKLSGADDSWLVTACENREMPTFYIPP